MGLFGLAVQVEDIRKLVVEKRASRRLPAGCQSRVLNEFAAFTDEFPRCPPSLRFEFLCELLISIPFHIDRF
jgi:hypothetical protein